ncbi:MAG: type II toxin-antitoxin system RelE/ParE family toxin [Candidatus Eremiobacteraeota bacterium]|nr:type II toxin-antitoxin system RelE/ParE family toxin [Candidatus Eremiobacteraeota bacterium]
MTKVYLTRNAISDIQAIYDYSIGKWNESVAESYLSDIESALQRCGENPGLLVSKPSLHAALRFYVVRKHLLVCDVTEHSIVVLTVSDARMDLAERLELLQPTLAAEIDLLRRRAKKSFDELK